MFPNVEVRHLLAVDILAEELNFTRAALRLNISQSALSPAGCGPRRTLQISPLLLATSDKAVELTEAGRVFVKEARSALLLIERAGHLAHAAHEGAVNVLTIGLSPCVEQEWISGLLTIRLPLYPARIKIPMACDQFPIDLVRSVLAGELDLALVAAPPEDSQITSVLLSRAQLCALLPEGHPAAHKESLVLQDLAQDAWILFSKQVHPLLRDAILEAAEGKQIVPKDVHGVLTAQDAFYLVAQHTWALRS